MIQDPNVERLIRKSIEPLNKQISMLQIELEGVKKQLAIPRVSGSSFTKDDLKKAFNSGRTLKNYKGEWIDNELIMDDHTDGKYSDFEDWFENYR